MGFFLVIALICFDGVIITSLLNEFSFMSALMCIWVTYMLCDTVDKMVRG